MQHALEQEERLRYREIIEKMSPDAIIQEMAWQSSMRKNSFDPRVRTRKAERIIIAADVLRRKLIGDGAMLN